VQLLRPSAAILVALAFVSAAAQAAQQASFRGRVDLVTMAVTVTDSRGQLVTDLTRDQFEILEDGRPQTLRLFAVGDAEPGETPLHLGIMLDVSESMDRDLPFVRSASIKLVNMLRTAEDVTVVDFDSEVRVARFSQRDFPRLVERIRQQKVGGFTSLYDAIGLYLDGASSQTGRKIVLIYTDGGDTRSRMDLPALLDLLKASDVTAYVIGALEYRSGSIRQELRLRLLRIAETTGGRAFFPTSTKSLDAVYEQVLAEVRAQYALGYVSTNERTDGAWRKVDVRVTRPGERYRVRSRQGYYALLRPGAEAAGR
jgi:Ca-activated chloride channel family protein